MGAKTERKIRSTRLTLKIQKPRKSGAFVFGTVSRKYFWYEMMNHRTRQVETLIGILEEIDSKLKAFGMVEINGSLVRDSAIGYSTYIPTAIALKTAKNSWNS